MTTTEQPRDAAGRFDEKAQSTPEVSLPATVTENSRARYRNRIHRVLMVNGDVVMLASPTGGRVMARTADVEPVAEEPAEREKNMQLERALAGVVASVKSATRLQREQLDAVSERDAARYADALDRAASAVAYGRVSASNWLVAHHCAAQQPTGVRLAIAALATKDGISSGDYQVLTELWRRHLGAVPAGD